MQSQVGYVCTFQRFEQDADTGASGSAVNAGRSPATRFSLIRSAAPAIRRPRPLLAVFALLLTAFAALADNTVGFRLGRYDDKYPLTIDPTLTWNTFLGGSGNDYGYTIAVDSSGNV